MKLLFDDVVTTDEIERALRAAADALPGLFEGNRLVAIVRT